MDMFYDIDDDVNSMIERRIADDCKVGDSKMTGLDERAFSTFWFHPDCIIIPADRRRSLDYYGGFEYIDSDHVRQYGYYVIYSAEADRVQEVLANLMEMEDA